MKKIIFIAIAALIVAEVIVLIFRFGPSNDTSTVQPAAPEQSPGSGSLAQSNQNPAPAPAPNLPPETKGVIRTEFFGIEPLPLNFEATVFEHKDDGRILKKDVATQLNDLNDPEQDPVEDIQILNSAVATYRQIFRENPIAGENREVVEALTGNNPYRLMFIDPSHPAINSNNELVDRWKTPYEFHPVSRDYMEIRSAGVDRQFGTGDDIMVEEPVEFGNPINFGENDE